MPYYPIFLDLKNRSAVVIGGGKVSERKTAALLKAGATVKVISPTLTSRLTGWVEFRKIEALLRPYRRGDLAGATLVFAATDAAAVNLAVAEEGKRKGIWVNVADRSAASEFILPAVLRRGDLTLAISTGGKSPAFVKRLKKELSVFLSADRALRVSRLARVKEKLIEGGVHPELRRAFLRYLADGEASPSNWRKSLRQAFKRSGLKESEQEALLGLLEGVRPELSAGQSHE